MTKNNEVDELMKAITDHQVERAIELIFNLEPKQFNKTDYLGYNPLHQAALYSELDLMKAIINKAEDKAINSSTLRRNTPLLMLIENNEIDTEVVEICEHLLSKMNDETINMKELDDEQTVLHVAAYRLLKLELCKAILKASPNIINIKNWLGETALDLVMSDNKKYGNIPVISIEL